MIIIIFVYLNAMLHNATSIICSAISVSACCGRVILPTLGAVSPVLCSCVVFLPCRVIQGGDLFYIQLVPAIGAE